MSAQGRTTSEGRRAAAGLLGELLSTRPAYRRRWEEEVVQGGGATPNQAAVARVLQAHRRRTGRPPGVPPRGRPLKDVVSRALSGSILSRPTLALFIEAFTMSPEDAARLWHLLQVAPPGPTPAPGPAPGPAPATSGSRRPPRGHRAGTRTTLSTLALRASQTLGPDGLPETTRTVHVVRAVERLAGYRYVLDPGVRELEVVRGGTSGSPYSLRRRTVVDVRFLEPLGPGQVASVEFVCRYRPGAPAAPVFRRGSRGRLENVELEVRFHPLRLPERVWWAIWPAVRAADAGVTGRMMSVPLEHLQEEVDPTPNGTVRRVVPVVENEAVGFRWRFPA